MPFLKDTPFYRESFQELNYEFGDYYLFESFVVAEIHKDVVFTWKDHGKVVAEEISHLYEQNGKGIVYISNRVNEYSRVPSDWFHFFRFNFFMKGYGIVSYSPEAKRTAILEKFFVRSKMQNFDNLDDAILWAKELTAQNEKKEEQEISA